MLLLAFTALSQQPLRENYNVKNEIRVNLLMSVIGLLTVDYEYFIEDNFGLGLSGSISLLDESASNLKGVILPYGRLYFGQNDNDGFFIEGNTGAVMYTYTTPSHINGEYIGTGEVINTTGFGIGVGAGYKFLTRNNWIGELQLGVGRIFNSPAAVEVYPRVAVSIGKRF